MARMNAERKLREAEESLRKLGVAVDSQTMIIKEDVHQEMVVNVKKLKREIFFFLILSVLEYTEPTIKIHLAEYSY